MILLNGESKLPSESFNFYKNNSNESLPALNFQESLILVMSTKKLTISQKKN